MLVFLACFLVVPRFFFLRNVHTFHTLPKFSYHFDVLEVSSYISVLKLRQKMKHPQKVRF